MNQGRRIITWILCVLSASGILAGCGNAGISGQNNPSSGSQESSGSGDASRVTSPDLEPVSKQSFYFDTICQITVYGLDEDVFLSSDAALGDGSQENSSRTDSDGASGTDSGAASGNVSWSGLSADERFGEEAQTVISHAFDLCSTYENLLSKTVEGSDIWNVNHAGGAAVSVDPRTVSIVQKGISYGDLSDGKFDITIGKAEDLWDFHSEDPHVPNADALQEAVSHVNYKTISVDEEKNTIRLSDPEAEIDLGGIAKGYIADGVCEQLYEDGVTAAIVSLGGNIECVGGKPSQNGFLSREDAGKQEGDFRIGIETPYSHETKIVGSSPLNNGTMVTSGVYERYFEQDGVQYHHILNPKTGYPVDTDVLGVTIQASEGQSADCDGLSTISLILGSSDGMKLIESLDGYEAVFIKRDDSVVKTDGIDFTPAQ